MACLLSHYIPIDEADVKEQIAAKLQARMTWAQAEACAEDIVQLFNHHDWYVAEPDED
jgi:hypothetical protein